MKAPDIPPGGPLLCLPVSPLFLALAPDSAAFCFRLFGSRASRASGSLLSPLLWPWRNPAAIRILAVASRRFLKRQQLPASFAQERGSFQESPCGPDLQLMLSSAHFLAAEAQSQRSPAFSGYLKRTVSAAWKLQGGPVTRRWEEKTSFLSLARLAKRGGWQGPSELPGSCQVIGRMNKAVFENTVWRRKKAAPLRLTGS